MATTTNTVKTVVQLDTTQAQEQVAKLNGIASDSTQDFTERIRAKNKVIKLSTDLSKQSIQSLEKELKALKESGASKKQIEQAEKKLTAAKVKAAKATANNTKQLNKLVKQQAKAKKSSNGLVSSFKSMGKSMLAFGAAAAGIGAVFSVFKSSIKTIAAFEQAMDKVQAVTGATSGEIKSLTEDAKRLGSTTSKSATQVAGLQLEFAKLGFSTAEILNATEATIALSIAAGSDLAESATIAASTVKGFGLSASETQRVTDVMAKSFSSSALDMSKFATAMSAVAPVAKASNKSLEFATAQISLLADSGLDASTAGTSLRNMFLELNTRGMTWEQGLEAINSSTNKNVTALELFGKRGATAALILADNTEKAKDLEDAYLGSAGAAKEMADIMEDNLLGDVASLSSAWEGFVLGLNKGEGVLSEFLREAVQLATELVASITQLTKSEQERIDAMQLDNINAKKQTFLDKLDAELKKTEDLAGENDRKLKFIEDEISKAKEIYEWNKKQEEFYAGTDIERSNRHENLMKQYEAYIKSLVGMKAEAENAAIKEQEALVEASKKAEQLEKDKQKNAKKEADRLARLEQQRLDAYYAEKMRQQKQHESDMADMDKELEAEMRKLERENEIFDEEELRRQDIRNRNFDAQVELDTIDLERRRQNGENVLQLELDLLSNLKVKELENTELTELEKQAIIARYANEEYQLKRGYSKAKQKLLDEEALSALNNSIMVTGFITSALGDIFGDNKAMAISLSIVDTIRGAISAFANTPTGIVGKSLAAGAALAAGYANIKKISAVSPPTGISDSGGSVSVPRTNFSTSTVSETAPTASTVSNIAQAGLSTQAEQQASNSANTVGGEVVFSEAKYQEFLSEVKFKEDISTI